MSKAEREHEELALLIAYVGDEYERTTGGRAGIAQALADNIQAAGFHKGPELSEEELEILRTALQVTIGRSKQTVRGGSYRTNRRNRSTTDSARTRRYRVLLEKLGGPKIPVAPVDENALAEEKPFEERGREADAERAKDLERRREKEKLRRRTMPKDPYWRYRNRLRGFPQKPVGASEISEYSDDAQEDLEDVRASATGQWTVEENDQWDPYEELDLSEQGSSLLLDNPAREYGVANYGDLEDVLIKSHTERTTREWAEGSLQRIYGDLLVSRPWRGKDK